MNQELVRLFNKFEIINIFFYKKVDIILLKMYTDKWTSLGNMRKVSVEKKVVKASVTKKKVEETPRLDITHHTPIISTYLNSKGEIFPVTKKKIVKQIWWVRQVNILPDDIIRYIYLLCLLSNERKWKKNHKRLSGQSFNKVSIVENNKFLYPGEKIDMGEEIWYFSPGSDKSRIETPFDMDNGLDNENEIIPIEPGEDMEHYKYDIHMPTFWMRSICHKYIYKWMREHRDGNTKFGIQLIKLNSHEISCLPDFVIRTRQIWNHYEDDDTNSFLTNDFIVCPKCRCYYCDIIRCCHARGLYSKNQKYYGLIHYGHMLRWSSYKKS